MGYSPLCGKEADMTGVTSMRALEQKWFKITKFHELKVVFVPWDSQEAWLNTKTVLTMASLFIKEYSVYSLDVLCSLV